MRVPLSWLKDFTPLDVDVSDRRRAVGDARDGARLARSRRRVDRDRRRRPRPASCSRGCIEIHAIEGADRDPPGLVDAATASPLEIVCGATNFALGDVVPLAPVGTELPGGMRIERRRMRGVDVERDALLGTRARALRGRARA